jgi:taurine dioxygenase
MSSSALHTISADGIALRPLGPAFGAEICGLDLTIPLSWPMLEVLHDALVEYGVLLLRGQQSLPGELACRLAALEVPLLGQALHQAAPTLPLTVRPVPDLPPPGTAPGLFWHADRSHAVEPSLVCLARAVAPAGAIRFVDQRRALALLPVGLRARLESLRAEHASPLDHTAKAEHPLVRRHPITGEASLYASPAFTTRILNLPAAESRRLLGQVFAAATAGSLAWLHEWQAGDVLIWDNRSMLHTACSLSEVEALRIEGDRPVDMVRDEMPWVVAG